MSVAGYPIEVTDPDGTVRIAGLLCYTDPALVPGAKWYDGGGPPEDRYGENGDYYLDDDNGDVYRKEGGTWV